MRTGPFADGEPILLIDRRGRRYLKRLKSGHPMTVRSSLIFADEIVGIAEGSVVGRGQPEQFHVFRPLYAELVPLLAREAQPIFAKDAGLIICRGDFRPGQLAIEVGVGAGAMTMALLRAVGPSGRLVSYELREEFAELARRHVTLYEGAAENWTVRLADARRGFEERDVDRVFVDIAEPVEVLEPAAAALKPGGLFLAFSPTVLPVKALHDTVAAGRSFAYAESFEVLERAWHVDRASVRPEQRMIAHTGFITIARRLAS